MKSSAHSRFVGAPLRVLGVQLLRVLPRAAAAAAAVDPQTRSAHWVIRTSKLETTLDFLKQVMGMRVLRHEENDEPCPITCNGDSPTAWSKTMVGYETEDKAWCLEVTYNYGVEAYATGSGLASFAVAVPDAVESARLATSLGYHVRHVGNQGAGGVMVLGPDGYRFSLVDKKASALSLPALTKREEPFLSVKLHVADLAVTQAFYSDVLGMTDLFGASTTTTTSGSPAAADEVLGSLRNDGDLVMGYSRDQVALIFRRSSGGAPPRIEQY
jgi:lactoylglutathione lyase